eukprot:COSAG05_NODE_696_length_7879_cov_9.218895_7_plen_145_part_00
MGARGDKVAVTRELVETEGGCGRGVAQSRVGAVRGRTAGGCLDCASQFSGRPPRQAGLRREDAAPEMEREKEKRVPAYMSGCGAGALLLAVAVATASGLCLPSSLLAPEQIQQPPCNQLHIGRYHDLLKVTVYSWHCASWGTLG